MSKFMMLIRNEGDPMADLTDAEKGAVMEGWGAYMGGLGSKLLDGVPFGGGQIVTGTSVIEGRHEEGNTNVGGYLIVEADTMAEAVAIAKDCPAVTNPTSSIEVRECLSM